jgi:hypothetical protein
MSNLEPCYKYLNILLNDIKPKKILYIGKIFGEYFLTPEKTPCIVGSEVTNYIIKEEPLENIEVLEFDNFVKTHSITNIIHLTFQEFKLIESFEEYDFVFVDTVNYYDILRHILNFSNYKVGVKLFFHDVCPCKEFFTYTQKIRYSNEIWIGETFLAFYNFYKKNPDNVKIYRDEIYTGFGIVIFEKNLNKIDSNLYDKKNVLEDLVSNEKFKFLNF